LIQRDSIAFKNPLKNGFFLLALWSFSLAMLTQRLGRSLTIQALQNETIFELDALKIQWHGLLQDVSVSSYYAMLACLIALFPWRLRLVQLIQSLFLISQGLLFALDLNLLLTWDSRFNALALSMVQFPAGTLQSLSFQNLCFISLFFICLVVISWLLNKALKIVIQPNDVSFKQPIWLLFVVGFAVVGIRGGVGKVPLNIGSSHFSNEKIENLLAINPNFNLYSVISQPNLKVRAMKALMNPSIEQFAMDAYMGPDTFPGGLKRMPQIIREGSNVLIVVLEGINQHWLESSLKSNESSKYIDGFGSPSYQVQPQQTAMPNLVKIAQDGMWFKKAYASGDRTDKGMASIFTAWPSQPWQGLLMNPADWTLINGQKMPLEFAKNGYSTSFVYGGDPNFANVGAFVKHIGFKKVVSPSQKGAGDWGVQDQPMVPLLLDELSRQKKPFFCSWLTLSSHEPYDVVAEDGLTQSQMLRKSIEYTDKAIGDLVSGLKKRNLYDSTVIIFVSDHGKTVGLPKTEDYEQEFFRIPIIITGGPIRDMYRGVAPQLVVSQTDIYATLTEQLLQQTDKLPFSRNMFFANHPGMAISFTEGKAVLAATGFRHHLFLDHFNQSTASDSIVLGLQSKIIRSFFSK
jgi:phosphoglycerol transferase MdoB-like AlkP superfamily enzyme